MSDTTRLPVGFTVSVGRILHGEIPAFDGTLRALTFGDGLHVDVLAEGKVTGSEAIADGEEVLGSDFELVQVTLGR